MKIPVNDLISLFKRMYDEKWEYIWRKAEKGVVDCSGAFVYAYRQFGLSISHGSNSIARKYIVGTMLPISEAKPGMAAFKAKLPGESGYDLPEKFKGSSDISDYYHIGLVDDKIKVLNAKGTQYGFCRDDLTRKSGWDCVAYLKDVDYGEEETMLEGTEAKVVLPQGASGNTVNLREGEGKNTDVIAKVPVGSSVQIIEDKGTWCKISYNGRQGWMMSNYLEYTGQEGETDTLAADDRDQIDKALLAIEKATEIIGCIIRRG